MAKPKDADTAPMGVDDVVAAFKELLLPEKQEAMKQMQDALSDGVSERKAQLMAELQALGGMPVLDLSTPKKRQTWQEKMLADGDARAVVKPLFRGPQGETWAGRGAAPRWLKALEEAGHNREEYRIKD